MTHFSIETDTPETITGEDIDTAESEIGWNLGFDMSADIYTIADIFEVSLIGSYRFSKVGIDEFITDIGFQITDPFETVATIHEYEFGSIVTADLSETLGVPVLPYAGVVFSDLSGNITANADGFIGGNYTEKISAIDNIGLRCGISAKPIENLLISIDGKLIDSYGVSGKVSYLF